MDEPLHPGGQRGFNHRKRAGDVGRFEPSRIGRVDRARDVHHRLGPGQQGGQRRAVTQITRDPFHALARGLRLARQGFHGDP